ncbi:hypothetical protein J2S19_000722 [Metabacillus malikii]|uniref:Uncharacterized protein n=1 Tax=Metabacillus malikii TaxID=1504265 RepID=A0ABT9ZB38_9BACI|nr:hypothetical protein [Metabacillus malikii]
MRDSCRIRGRGDTLQAFTPRKSKSVGGLPIDVQTRDGHRLRPKESR